MDQVYEEIENEIPNLRRYAMSLTGDRERSNDLVQDCVARALDKSKLFKTDTNLRAWLFTIMHNVNATQFRRRRSMPTSVDPEIIESTLSTPPNQEDRVALQTVRKALKTLPREQRETIVMAGPEGKTYIEIASAQGVPVGTVKSRLARGRAALKSLLRGQITYH